MAASQFLRAPSTYRARDPATGVVEERRLPARLCLRPLASHAVAAYLAAALFLAWVSPRFTARILLLFVFPFWLVLILLKYFRGGESDGGSNLQRRRLLDMDETH